MWRYIAKRATTGEILDLDLPLARDELTWALSASGSLRGTVEPDVGNLRAEDGRLLLEEWGTLLYAEADGEIRWGGILVRSTFEGQKWSIEAASLSTYPHGMPYLGDYEGIDVDPADVVREIWHHLQSQPDGDLGVVVEGKTPVRIGEEAHDVEFSTSDGSSVAFEAGPKRLHWSEAPDCGGEIDSLAKETAFDFTESVAWQGDSDDTEHLIQIHYPRAGRRRTDLVFSDDVNIVDSVPVSRDGDDYANSVFGIGAGEGDAVTHRSTAKRDGRLRRVAVYTDKSVDSNSRMDERIRRELTRRLSDLSIESITVRDHPNAVIGSWALGDDVLVEVDVPWLGPVSLWCRVVGWSLLADDTARLSLARSDSFTYGG